MNNDIIIDAVDNAALEYASNCNNRLPFDSTVKDPFIEAFIEGAKFVLGKLNAVFIEKELLNPVSINGYAEVVGPYYHVYRFNENLEKEEIFVETSGGIKEAARRAEHELDVEKLAIAYKENPNSFKSTIEPPEYVLDDEDAKEITDFINAKLAKHGQKL